jgi:peptidoglycan/LPS O-acetylase OafA/YrhL
VPATVKPRSSSYIPGLDGIRAVAFSLVYFAHSAGPKYGVYVPATLGVTIFFFLSGYLITTLLRKEFSRTGTIAFRDFYLRRALRILTPLYLVYGVATLVGFFVLHAERGSLAGFLSMVFYYFNYGYALREWQGLNIFAPAGMGVIWSLCIEEHFYFLFPLAFLGLSRSRLTRRWKMNLLVGFCLLELLWRAFLVAIHLRDVGGWTYYATDCRLDSILWGAVLAMFANPMLGDRVLLPKRSQATVFGMAVLGMVGSLAVPGDFYRDACRYTLQALLLLVIFSFIITRPGHWSVRWLEWPVVRYVGWTSYVLYLCHSTVLEVISVKLPQLTWLPKASLGLAGSLLFATAMRYTVELPLQSLRARFRHVPERDLTAQDGHGLIS